jgi:hypothetical protein
MDKRLRVEVADFAGKLREHARQVRLRYGANPATTRQQCLPEGLPANADGADNAQACDYDFRCWHPDPILLAMENPTL